MPRAIAYYPKYRIVFPQWQIAQIGLLGGGQDFGLPKGFPFGQSHQTPYIQIVSELNFIQWTRQEEIVVKLHALRMFFGLQDSRIMRNAQIPFYLHDRIA